MRAINHALTGAVIGLTIDDPLLAAPLAFLSHFVCDVIPHFGKDGWRAVQARWFQPVLIVDALLCLMLVLVLLIARPTHWLSAIVCAFWRPPQICSQHLVYYVKSVGKIPRPNTRRPFIKFHQGIQWFERPIGAVVEVAWFIAALIILVPLLSR